MLDFIIPIVAWSVVGGIIGGTILIWCLIIGFGPDCLGGWLGPLVRARLDASLGRCQPLSVQRKRRDTDGR